MALSTPLQSLDPLPDQSSATSLENYWSASWWKRRASLFRDSSYPATFGRALSRQRKQLVIEKLESLTSIVAHSAEKGRVNRRCVVTIYFPFVAQHFSSFFINPRFSTAFSNFSYAFNSCQATKDTIFNEGPHSSADKLFIIQKRQMNVRRTDDRPTNSNKTTHHKQQTTNYNSFMIRCILCSRFITRCTTIKDYLQCLMYRSVEEYRRRTLRNPNQQRTKRP